MTKINYGDEVEYADTRIRGTVLKAAFEERVLTVGQLDYDDMRFKCSDCITGEYLNYDLSELDMSPLKLGYANAKTKATYLSRMPTRHYKQGLTPATLSKRGAGYGDNINYNSPALAKCALNIYPSMLSATEEVSCGEAHSRAFSRNFMVDIDTRLQFRGTIVGEVHFNPSNGLIHARLTQKFKFLQEMLEDETTVQQ